MLFPATLPVGTGIAQAGWGLLDRCIAMALMYFTLVLSLAEMSAAIPTAGGGYSFARQAMGPLGGYITGLSVLIEYALAPAAIVIFIGSAVNELIGIDGPIVYLVSTLSSLLFTCLVLAPLKVMMVISALAVIAILLTAAVLIGQFDINNLFDIPPTTYEATRLLPMGWYGVWAALPFAMWLFLAVEGVPLAAEEAKNPAKDVPRES